MQSKILTDADPGQACLSEPQPGSPEAARPPHNQAILAKIESGLIELENAVTKLDSLTQEQTRLQSEVEKVASAEAELLRDESLSESTATKRLIEIRARADVLRARAKAAGERTDEPLHALQTRSSWRVRRESSDCSMIC